MAKLFAHLYLWVASFCALLITLLAAPLAAQTLLASVAQLPASTVAIMAIAVREEG